MMGIERSVTAAVLAALAIGAAAATSGAAAATSTAGAATAASGAAASSPAAAAPPAATAPSPPWFALADLRQPKQLALLYASTGPAPGKALSYVPLAAADTKPHVACCVQVRGPAKPDADSGAALLQADAEAPPLQRQAARLSKPEPGPVIALAIDGRRASVDSIAPQTLLIRWPGRAAQLQVQHCTSPEGLHVRVTTRGSTPPQPVRHFYLPLGMDVEADCPAEMMVAPAK